MFMHKDYITVQLGLDLKVNTKINASIIVQHFKGFLVKCPTSNLNKTWVFSVKLQ